MVQVRVAGVAMDSMAQHVILLKPLGDAPGTGSIVPIWIGAQEATSILVAVEHAMLVAAFNMLTNGEFYRDPGADYFTRHAPAKTRARAIGQLESLGYRVTLQPLADTA